MLSAANQCGSMRTCKRKTVCREPFQPLSDATAGRTGMNEVIANLAHRLPSARKIWLNLHLWLGLTAGFALALIGLTGSLLVLTGPLQRIPIGDIFSFQGPAPHHATVDA